MASNSNPIDINHSSLGELKLIPNIWDKRAQAIVKLRYEKGSLILEDKNSKHNMGSSCEWGSDSIQKKRDKGNERTISKHGERTRRQNEWDYK